MSHPDAACMLWSEYLSSLKIMLPYFAGTWHRAYKELESLDNFTKQQFEDGNFVVRRTKKVYAGISVDLAIE